jgi:hypothetical protein
VNLGKFLLEHGVFNNLDDVELMIHCMIQLLNGTTDFCSPEEEE